MLWQVLYERYVILYYLQLSANDAYYFSSTFHNTNMFTLKQGIVRYVSD